MRKKNLDSFVSHSDPLFFTQIRNFNKFDFTVANPNDNTIITKNTTITKIIQRYNDNQKPLIFKILSILNTS